MTAVSRPNPRLRRQRHTTATTAADSGDRLVCDADDNETKDRRSKPTIRQHPSRLNLTGFHAGWCALCFASSACLISGGGGVADLVLDGREHAER